LKLIMPLADEDRFVLARDSATISIKEILDGVRNAGKSLKARDQKDDEETAIDDLLLQVDQATGKALEGKTLQALIVSLDPRFGRG